MTDGFSRRELLQSAAALGVAALRLRASQTPTYTGEVKVVNVLATVRDKQGRIVRNLGQSDFVLEEDGRPQIIRYFARESDLPLTLGLLIDTSMSQRTVLPQERTASYRFLEQVLREDKDQAFVIHFDREVELLQDLTSSRKKLEDALTGLETPQRDRPQWGGAGDSGGGGPQRGGGQGGGRRAGTTLYDAVLLASDDLMKKQTGRKAFIVLSDGVDTGSKTSIESAIESAQRADTLAYSILFKGERMSPPGGFGGPGWGGGRGRGRGGMGGPRSYPSANRPDGKKVLERIASQTGAGFFEVSGKQPIEKIYEQIDEELRSQYSLGFSSDRPEPGAGFHHIHLTTRDKSLQVRARDGYYAG
jgi:VWFA-related protein